MTNSAIATVATNSQQEREDPDSEQQVVGQEVVGVGLDARQHAVLRRQVERPHLTNPHAAEERAQGRERHALLQSVENDVAEVSLALVASTGVHVEFVRSRRRRRRHVRVGGAAVEHWGHCSARETERN